ncbi:MULTISPECIES: hypothetical protein [unclassified Wolbachia]|uniref:hypothetical protein n=1 Tax=unclassified Wolbachia TaxID=2640676 RepID=UPI0031331233
MQLENTFAQGYNAGKYTCCDCAQLFIKNKKGKTAYDLSQNKSLVQDLFATDKEIRRHVGTDIGSVK